MTDTKHTQGIASKLIAMLVNEDYVCLLDEEDGDKLAVLIGVIVSDFESERSDMVAAIREIITLKQHLDDYIQVCRSEGDEPDYQQQINNLNASIHSKFAALQTILDREETDEK